MTELKEALRQKFNIPDDAEVTIVCLPFHDKLDVTAAATANEAGPVRDLCGPFGRRLDDDRPQEKEDARLLHDFLRMLRAGMAPEPALPRSEIEASGNPRNKPAVDDVLYEVRQEVVRAEAIHGPMNSPHEAYAVIKEELDELWDEIKADDGRADPAREEAVQLAAMAIRYLIDLDPHDD